MAIFKHCQLAFTLALSASVFFMLIFITYCLYCISFEFNMLLFWVIPSLIIKSTQISLNCLYARVLIKGNHEVQTFSYYFLYFLFQTMIGGGAFCFLLTVQKGYISEVFEGPVMWLYDAVTEACTVLYTMLLCQGFKWGPTDSVGLGGV